MPPRRQDPVEQHDARNDDPEAPERARGSRAARRSSKKRRRPSRRKGRRPAADGTRTPAGDGEAAEPVSADGGQADIPGAADADPPLADTSPGAPDADPAPEDMAPGAPDQDSLKRRARVAAYAHPADAPHSPRDLDAVADLARELAQLSTPETRSRLLAAAVAHADAKEARYRVPMKEPGAELRWKAPFALAIFTAAALAAVAPPAWLVPEAPAHLDAGARLHGIRLTLLLQAQQVEAFRAREQRLPDSLDDVAVRFAGVRFVKSNSRIYQLVGYTPGGEAVVYDPAEPGADFERLGASWSLSLHALHARQ